MAAFTLHYMVQLPHPSAIYFLSPRDRLLQYPLVSHNTLSHWPLVCWVTTFLLLLVFLSFFSLAPLSLFFYSFLLHIIKLPPLSNIARGGRSGLSLRGRHHGPLRPWSWQSVKCSANGSGRGCLPWSGCIKAYRFGWRWLQQIARFWCRKQAEPPLSTNRFLQA